jgi:diguanylate cyclase (GGDEF)-like protein/PAS domain S-box-containing protein
MVRVPAVLILIGLAVTCLLLWLTRLLRQPGAGFLVVGMLLSGVSTAAAGIAWIVAPGTMLMDVPLPAELPNIGLFFTTGTLLLGLLTMPGVEATLVGRLRRALDGLGIGICLFFVAWLLIFSSIGLRGAALTATLLGSITISGTIVGTMRSAQRHRAALVVGGGVLLSIVGSTGLVIVLDYPPVARGWLSCVCVLLAIGPVIAWYGLRYAFGHPEPPARADRDGSFVGYPMLALPLGAAMVAAGYHLVQGRVFDPTAMTLALVGVLVLTVRETLAVIDVRRYAGRLASREEHFRSLVAGANDVTMVLGPDLIVAWQSPAAARRLGLSDQDVVGRPVRDLLHPDEVEQVTACLTTTGVPLLEARVRDGFGAWRDTEWSLSDQRGVPAVGGMVVHIRDISERKNLERIVHQAEFVDQLTGLPNRRHLIRAMTGGGEPRVLVVCAVGGMTGVNQIHGHEVGDAVLVEAGRRLRAGLAAGDFVARLDGEEFAVLTGAGAIEAQLLATRLLSALTEPYQITTATARVSASAGLVDVDPGGVPGDTTARAVADEALQRARLAMRRARRRGPGGGAEWHDSAKETVLRRRLTIEQELPEAVARGDLDLLYQPILRLPGRQPVGVEALLCWRHPGLGMIDAGELLPVAEEVGLLDDIGDWLLHRACRQLAGWLRDDRDVWLSVNVSAAQLAGPAFVGTVAAAVDEHQVPAARLVVEFAETDLDPKRTGPDEHADALVAGLTELRSLGARTALDRFGTRSTSLSQLRLLPLDLLKLDRQQFAEPAARTGGRPTAIIDAVVNLAHQLGVDVAMQGLDTPADVAEATRAGCRLGQGDALGRPGPAERLEAFLDDHRPSAFHS